MSTFNRLPGESQLDYIWRNFGGKTVQGESNIILTDDLVDSVVIDHIDKKAEEIIQQVDQNILNNVTTQIQEKIIGDVTESVTIEVTDGTISANVKIDESESPVKLSVSENGVKASLEIDTDSSVELSTSSGKLKADVPLVGTQTPIRFLKISSNEYFKLGGDIEMGKMYLLSDAPDIYLDGQKYGNSSTLIDGLVSSIRYENGYIYYTIVGNPTEKLVKIDEVSETNPGLMTSEKLKALNNIIKVLAGVDNVSDLVDNKILEIELNKEDNTIKLTYKDETLGEIELSPDKYLSDVSKRKATSDDVLIAKSFGVNIVEGEDVIVFDVENGDIFYISILDLVLNSLISNIKGSDTISILQQDNDIVASVIINTSTLHNLLKSTDDGLVAELELSSNRDNLLRYDEDDDKLVATLNWNSDPTETGVKFGKGKLNEYDSSDSDLIYIATDTNTLHYNGVCFSLTEDQLDLIDVLQTAVIDVEYKNNEFTFTTAKSDPISIKLPIVSHGDDGVDGLMSSAQAEKLDKLTVFKPGKGLIIENESLDILISENDKLLSINNSNEIVTSLELKYEDSTIKLLGKDETLIGSISLSQLKDGVIKSVDTAYVDDNNVPGFYLVFTWSKEAFDTEEDVIKYINLLELLKTYDDGDGISIGSDNKISLKLATDEETRKYLSFNEDGYLVVENITSTINSVETKLLQIINGKDETDTIRNIYTESKSVADDILDILDTLKDVKDFVDDVKDNKFVKDVLVNDISVVENLIAKINLTAENVVYIKDADGNEVKTSVQEIIDIINGDNTTEGSFRKEIDDSWEWQEDPQN